MQTYTQELSDALILVVDDNIAQAKAVRQGLAEFDNVVLFHSGKDALNFCRIHTPQLIILNVHMPDLDGWATCRRLREVSLLTRCPIIFLTSSDKDESEIACWESGETDYLRKPVSPAALNMLVMSHLTTHWHIEISNQLRHTDSLTGLKNRYYYDRHINDQLAYARRYKSDMSILIVDVDYFRHFNSAHGHKEGDHCLRQVAHIVRKSIFREPDCVCRYSGEEFVIILPGTDLNGALHVGTKIVNAISDAEILHPKSPLGIVTASIGAASLQSLEVDEISLIEKADKQLQIAKNTGRCKVA